MTAKEIFAAAIELPAEQRHAFIEAQTAGDSSLRAAVESLLASHQRASSFLSAPTMEPSVDTLPVPPPSQAEKIGPYKLLQVIGEGGFGTVYMAEQEQPVRRTVALKLIKLGMDTRQVIARFEAERQALAMMDHPNIARVFDAGATDTGRPYFVMELVKGVPVTTYCDSNRLTPRQRLELFIPICQAVQHAHQKGVIHRDIKPSNVLVTLHDGRPVPKVIDFGVAKATQARLTEKTVFTEFKQMIGTPEYMSPEQAEMSGLDIDTRTDVYSLGVLLYELLTGLTPFDPRALRSRAYAEMQRIIREVDPPNPSTRVSTSEQLPSIAAQRGIEPRKLTSTVRGELDWIVMKCLEKDRTRRYDSPSALASDVAHYLADEPVVASPPSRVYRMQKFVRRNRGVMAGAMLLAAVLLAGAITSTLFAVRARRERQIADEQRALAQAQEQEARRQAAIAHAVSEFQADMLSSADPDRLLGDKVTVLQAVNAAVRELDAGKLKDQPLVEAGVRQVIGSTLRTLARYEEAESNLRKALELRRTATGGPTLDTAQTLTDLGLVVQERNRLDEAEAAFREALEIRRGTLVAGHPDIAESINNLARLRFEQRRYAEAEPQFREALAMTRQGLPPGYPNIATALNNLSQVLEAQGKYPEAETLARESLDIRRANLPSGHPDIAQGLVNLAGLLMSQGKLPDAEPLYLQALEIYRKAMPGDHPTIATTLNNLATLYQTQGQYDQAEAMFRESLQIVSRVLPPNDPDVLRSRNKLALALVGLRRLDEAESLARGSVEVTRARVPVDSRQLAVALDVLGQVLQEHDKLEAAESSYREALDIRQRTLPAGSTEIAQSLNSVARALLAQKKPEQAEPLFRQSLEIYRKALPADHQNLAVLVYNVASLLETQGKFPEAEPLFREAVQIFEKRFGPDNMQLATARLALGRTCTQLKRWTEAQRELLECHRALAGQASTGNQLARCRRALATLYDAWELDDPGKGHKEQAQKWRLAATTSAPASQP
jgi:serine/threonine protein kinase/tetratricopeptide (TPR) repeat protein